MSGLFRFQLSKKKHPHKDDQEDHSSNSEKEKEQQSSTNTKLENTILNNIQETHASQISDQFKSFFSTPPPKVDLSAKKLSISDEDSIIYERTEPIDTFEPISTNSTFQMNMHPVPESSSIHTCAPASTWKAPDSWAVAMPYEETTRTRKSVSLKYLQTVQSIFDEDAPPVPSTTLISPTTISTMPGEGIKPASSTFLTSSTLPSPSISRTSSIGSEQYYQVIEHSTLTQLPKTKNWAIRVYKPLPKHSSNMEDTSFVIVSCPLDTTTKDLKTILSNKFFSHDYSKYQLYVVHRGSERLLYDEDRPIGLQKCWLEELGYIESDNLPMIGQEDHTYAFRFLFMEYNPSSSIPRSFHRHFKSLSGEIAPGIIETRADLSGQDLYMIPVILFRYAATMEHLDLSKNLMLNLPMDLVQSCICLKSIRMSECELYTIPPALSYADTLTKLDLSMNLLQGKSLSPLEALHNLLDLNLQSNQITEIPSNLAEPLSTLQSLNLASNGLVQFPDIILSSWTNLIYINMAFNFIRYIPPEISKMTKLRELNIVCNQLVSLPESFSLSNLTLLDIRGNAIQDISMILMPKLTKLVIDHNSIGSFPTLSLPQIKEITASRNALSHIQLKNDISPLLNLSILSLSGSKLVSLPTDLFEYCPRLESLILDDNQIRNIPPSINLLSSTLKFLSLINNKLTELPTSIGELTKLTNLNVRGNNLKTLPDSIWSCSSLSIMNISSNLLYIFPFPLEQSKATMAYSLKELYLGDNRLHDDSLDAIQYLINLEILNLSYNSYYEIGSSMKGFVNLKQLYLSGNQLMSLPDEIDRLRNLNTLFVNSNKLATLPAELGKITVLMELDASDNNLRYNITNWPYDWNWNWNVELKYLNLSGNRKFDIRTNNVVPTSGDGSRNLADFSSLHQLNILDVTEVKIIPSSIPQEQQNRRVRWSKHDQASDDSLPPSMFGVADYLAKYHCVCWDSISVSRSDKELVASLFDGRVENDASGRIAKYLNDSFYSNYRNEIQELRQNRDVTTIDGLSLLYQDALRRCFLNMNRDLSVSFVGGIENNGASAIVAHLMATRLLVANVGDAMGVVCRAGHPLVVSTRHSPWNRTERSRIRRVGGYVRDDDGLLHGTVGVSRAFGYHDLIPSIVSDPSLYVVELTDSDEFIILANHGLWKWIDPQIAIDIARTESDNFGLASRKLRDSAILSGASEHISVLVIGLQGFHNEIVGITGPLLVPSTISVPAVISETKKRRSQRDDVTDSSLARLGHEIPAPTGHVTIVFTDVRNSTLLWEAQPAAMEAAMKLHNTIMRRLLRTVGGYEVKTEGDAFMAAFPTVFKALKWCLFAQSQLLEAEWPQEILDSEEGSMIKDRSNGGVILYRGLSVRMGLHCGAPICEPDPLTQRMDYFGSVVIKASRVSATALGGQIVATSDVHTVFQGIDKAERIALLDPVFFELGERKLKGLEQSEFVYAVYPRSLVSRFGFVPAPIIGSSFDDIRRESEIAFPLDMQMVKQLDGIADRLERIAKQFNRNITIDSNSIEIASDDTKKNSFSDDMLASLESIISRIEMATSAISLVQMDQYSLLVNQLRKALDNRDPIMIIKTLKLYQTIINQ